MANKPPGDGQAPAGIMAVRFDDLRQRAIREVHKISQRGRRVAFGGGLMGALQRIDALQPQEAIELIRAFPSIVPGWAQGAQLRAILRDDEWYVLIKRIEP